MELYCTPKSQYTTVKRSRKLLEHTYTSDPHGIGTLTPIEFFQQDLLWQSSNAHCHSCSHKAFKHTSGQSIVGLSVHLHTTTALRRIGPSLTCTSPDDRMSSSSAIKTRVLPSEPYPFSDPTPKFIPSPFYITTPYP
jgi:hypothetical protein